MSFYDHFSNLSYLVLEAGSTCNLKCRYCPRNGLVENGLRPNKIMTLSEYQHILDQLKDCPITDIKLHGLSEAMTIKNFDRHAAMVREYFPQAKIVLVTNQQYDIHKTAFLKTLPLVDSVWLSIDGAEKTFEYIRRGAKWSRTLGFLEDLVEAVPSEIRRQKFHIQYTLSSENYFDLPKMYEIRDKYKLNSVRYNLVQEWKGEKMNDHLKYDDEVIEFMKQCKDDLMGVAGWQYKDCFWPYEGIFIDAYGDIRHCIMNYTMKPIGNVFKDNLKDIYNESPVFIEARTGLSRNCPPEQCQTCDYHFLSAILTKIHGKEFFHRPRTFKYQKFLTTPETK